MSLLLAAQGVGAAEKAPELVYIGTRVFGEAAVESSAQQGIYAIDLDATTGHLSSLGIVQKLQNATWMVFHPSLPIAYSVAAGPGGMTDNSLIYSFTVNKTTGNLTELNHVNAGGVDATHLYFDAPTATLFSANHGSGNVTVFPVQANGTIEPFVSQQRDDTVGTDVRQKKPAAHAVVMDPTHRWLLVNQFSADHVWIYRFDSKKRTLTPAAIPFLTLPAVSGPRHLLFHPNGRFVYVNDEASGEIRTFEWDAKRGRLTSRQAVSAYADDYVGRKSAAEIAIAHDGRFLYLSLRGDQDSIVAYSIDAGSGYLMEIQRISSQGKSPWSFGIDPSGQWMLVTNALSNVVSELRIDTRTGKLASTGESLTIPSPVSVAFYPR